MQGDVRIDKWLWAVRIYKTRSLATDSIRSGKVHVNEQVVKPSRLVKPGEVITISLNPIRKTVKVIGIPEHRMSAKLVENYLQDLTPQEEYDKLKVNKETGFEYRQRGIGRERVPMWKSGKRLEKDIG